jgi:hypothetical protein
MARSLSLPHERRKAQLKATILRERVRVSESRERITKARAELAAMTPQPKPSQRI